MLFLSPFFHFLVFMLYLSSNLVDDFSKFVFVWELISLFWELIFSFSFFLGVFFFHTGGYFLSDRCLSWITILLFLESMWECTCLMSILAIFPIQHSNFFLFFWCFLVFLIFLVAFVLFCFVFISVLKLCDLA